MLYLNGIRIVFPRQYTGLQGEGRRGGISLLMAGHFRADNLMWIFPAGAGNGQPFKLKIQTYFQTNTIPTPFTPTPPLAYSMKRNRRQAPQKICPIGIFSMIPVPGKQKIVHVLLIALIVGFFAILLLGLEFGEVKKFPYASYKEASFLLFFLR
jgi:hypothetical protein